MQWKVEQVMKKQILTFCVLLAAFVVFHTGCSLSLFNRPDQTTILKLRDSYKIILHTSWTKEKSEILLSTLDSAFQSSDVQSFEMSPSTWMLSDEDIQSDVKIEIENSIKLVSVNPDVFSDEESGELIETKQRLFHVIAQFITEDWSDLQATRLILKDGTDREAIELVLKEFYGLSIVRTDTSEAEKISQKLHKYVGEVHVSEFSNEDLIKLMTVYELFPRGLDRIPKMKYLLRREKAPYAGSAWIVADCIEYDGRTFRINSQKEFKHIIIHEKAHFLWEYALNGKLRKAWSELGGWHKDPNNRNRWLKSKDRKEFVTDYAYAKNPNEDWAESVAFYLSRPDRLRSCSLAKYDFIDRVMMQYQDGGVPFKRLKNIEN